MLPEPPRPARRRLVAELLLALGSLLAFALVLLGAELALRVARPDALDDQPQAGLARLHRYSEAYGWELRPGAVALVDGQRVSVNRLGQRGREHARARTPGGRRLLMLGDSVAFGYGVGDEQTFSHLLERRGFEVVNLAVPGYGTDQELLRLEREGLSWRPDAVLLHFCLENDPVDNVSPRFFYDDLHPKPYFDLQDGGLVLRDAHVRLAPAGRAALWLRERSHLLNRLAPRPPPRGEQWRQRKAAVLGDERRARALTLRLVARAAESAAGAGARFILVVHPNREAFQHGSPWRDALLALTLPQGARALDMAAAYRERGLRFRDVTLEAIGHLSARGHEVAAEALADSIG